MSVVNGIFWIRGLHSYLLEKDSRDMVDFTLRGFAHV